jgi:hypothetical protein
MRIHPPVSIDMNACLQTTPTADDRPLPDRGVGSDGDRFVQDALPQHSTGTDFTPSTHHGSLEDRAGLDDGLFADHAPRQYLRLGLDPASRA